MSQAKGEGYECTKCGAWCPVPGEPCLSCPIGTWHYGIFKSEGSVFVPFTPYPYQVEELKRIQAEIDRIAEKMESEPITDAEMDFIFANKDALEE